MLSGRSRAHLPRNERTTLEVAIVRPNLAANRSVQTWLCLPLTPWVHHEAASIPRYTGIHLPAWLDCLMRALHGSDLTSHRSEPSSLSRCPRFRACATERAHDSVARQIACCCRLDLPSRLGSPVPGSHISLHAYTPSWSHHKASSQYPVQHRAFWAPRPHDCQLCMYLGVIGFPPENHSAMLPNSGIQARSTPQTNGLGAMRRGPESPRYPQREGELSMSALTAQNLGFAE